MKVLVHVPGGEDRRRSRHGAVRHARTIAGLVAQQGPIVVGGGPADVTHTQFADALWGADVDAAASAYETWAVSAPRPLVVTLHDVPGADPDASRDFRRGDGYARVIAASDAVIVSSRHEAAKVARLAAPTVACLGGPEVGRWGRAPVAGLGAPTVHVIGLPLPAPAPAADGAGVRWPSGATLGLLGFVYPGKGHAEVIEAAGRLSPSPAVVSIGAVSAGHDALRRQLARHAGRHGVRLVVTGPMSGTRLATAAATVTVPVMANRWASASASLLTWVGHRRRPLVAAGEYSREHCARHPGTILLYDGGGELDGAIADALRCPARTRLDGLPPWPDTGAEHVEVYRRLLAATGAASAS